MPPSFSSLNKMAKGNTGTVSAGTFSGIRMLYLIITSESTVAIQSLITCLLAFQHHFESACILSARFCEDSLKQHFISNLA